MSDKQEGFVETSSYLLQRGIISWLGLSSITSAEQCVVSKALAFAGSFEVLKD